MLTVRVPPLRERREDVLPLARSFLSLEKRPAAGFTLETEAALLAYRWPGNVRELGNAVKHGCALARGGLIRPAHLPEELERVAEGPPAQGETVLPAPGRGAPLSLAEAERAHVVATLEYCGGSQAEAARRLGIGRTTLWRKLRRWDLAESTRG